MLASYFSTFLEFLLFVQLLVNLLDAYENLQNHSITRGSLM